MAKTEVCKQGLRCERCNHIWIPRGEKTEPEVCPKCHSPYWNKPRKKKTPITRKPTQREIDKAGIGGAT